MVALSERARATLDELALGRGYTSWDAYYRDWTNAGGRDRQQLEQGPWPETTKLALQVLKPEQWALGTNDFKGSIK